MPRERTYLRYQVYKSQARKQAGVTFAKLHKDLLQQGIVDVDHSRVRFEAIDAQALRAYEEWFDPHFSWRDVVRWKAKEPLSFNAGGTMKAAVEKKAPGARPIKADRKRSSGKLSEQELHRIREALVNPAAEEPGGVLAGASFTFSS